MKLRSEDYYQIALIATAVLVTALFGVFLYREIYPQYKEFQKIYVELEEFRSTYTGTPPPPFSFGIKQIVIPDEDRGPAKIDRCISCHVALDFEHFSPTTLARDVNGNIIYDNDGIPEKVPNPNFIWKKLDEKIANLRKEGNDIEADRLESLKTVRSGEHEYRADKALIMHPLIGRETRPFEYHPVDEYGCTVCHSGNGRSLEVDRAHGPVYDGEYEETYMGPVPEFLESDPDNDPKFSRVFNAKPGHRLLFQTTPLLVGNLIQAKCVLCHRPTSRKLSDISTKILRTAERKSDQLSVIRRGFEQEYNALVALLSLRKFLQERGAEETMKTLEEQAKDYTRSPDELEKIQGNIEYLRKSIVEAEEDPEKEKKILKIIDRDLIELLGSMQVVEALQKAFDEDEDMTLEQMKEFLKREKAEGKPGSMHKKAETLEQQQKLQVSIDNVTYAVRSAAESPEMISGLQTDIDRLTPSFQRGEELFFSQACYACHRITGLARGGIAPELTDAGLLEPWYLKESIVWPQADLRTSTMPNFHLDHEELEDLMTFLLAQRPANQSRQGMENEARLRAWEAGKKNEWEEPVSPSQIRDVRRSMEIFASEGCASCHRLKGFDSNVGFAVEKNDPSFTELYEERQWFRRLFPEDAFGSSVVRAIDEHKDEIDEKIVDGVRQGAILEEIERKYPKLIESFYDNFKFASRAKNHQYRDDQESLDAWKERVRRVMLMYVQEYGLGRLVGPRPNWSGIYRSDKWLMEHFWNPSALIAQSIMPVFPFDNTKFLALTYMLNALAQKNLGELREVWEIKGFDPESAFQTLCAQCHGPELKGNGPVSEWIYPVPKSLANPVFLRNLTRERAVHSIVHGIYGTPMPPWGETPHDKDFKNDTPVLTEDEAVELVNWIYRDLIGERIMFPVEDVRKWQYTPEDVIEELRRAGDILDSEPQSSLGLPPGVDYLVSLNPTAARPPDLSVDDVFDVAPNPFGGPEEYHYYIKKKYYTERNLAAGKALFDLNCAVCHGRDADGAGLRAGVMEDAKPRMLINLPWIESRDDLRLLRSIYFGVPGTSMIAFGDQTTSLQRLQLVMFIRSLTEQRRAYQQFENVLYTVFQVPVWALQDARARGTDKIQSLEKEAHESRMTRQRIEALVEAGEAEPADTAELYSKELEAIRQLRRYRETDQILHELIEQVQEERNLYKGLGDLIFNVYGPSAVFDDMLQAVQANEIHFSYKEGELEERRSDDDRLEEVQQKMLKVIREDIQGLERQKTIEEGKMATPEQKERLSEIETELDSRRQLEREVVSTFSQAGRLRDKQMKAYHDYLKKLRTLEETDD